MAAYVAYGRVVGRMIWQRFLKGGLNRASNEIISDLTKLELKKALKIGCLFYNIFYQGGRTVRLSQIECIRAIDITLK